MGYIRITGVSRASSWSPEMQSVFVGTIVPFVSKEGSETCEGYIVNMEHLLEGLWQRGHEEAALEIDLMMTQCGNQYAYISPDVCEEIDIKKVAN